MSASKIGVTARQWLALDTVRAHGDARHTPPAAWISDVAEYLSAHDDCTRGAAKRALSDMKRAGLIDMNHWRVWLTDAGRAFLETKSEGL